VQVGKIQSKHEKASSWRIGELMAKKCVVKVVLSKEQRENLSELARRLGTSESEMLRTAFMDYAKELSMVKERLHREKQFDLNLK
jgi:hypothetical protein